MSSVSSQPSPSQANESKTQPKTPVSSIVIDMSQDQSSSPEPTVRLDYSMCLPIPETLIVPFAQAKPAMRSVGVQVNCLYEIQWIGPPDEVGDKVVARVPMENGTGKESGTNGSLAKKKWKGDRDEFETPKKRV
jgi:hypothetical protein